MGSAVGAGTASVFRTTRDDEAKLRRDDIEPLRDVLADAMQAAATGADQAFRFDNFLNTRKMSGKRAAIGGAGFRLRLPRRYIVSAVPLTP